MTPRKRWPNEANAARLDAIALARKIADQVEPMLLSLEASKPVSSLELSLRLGRVQATAKEIALRLVEAGPQEFKD